jgi:hypothetical protein
MDSSRVVVPVAPSVSWGLTSYLGVFLTVLGSVGAVVAAVKGNDTATVAGAAAGGLTALVTLGGRFAQAVAAVRRVAADVGPWVDALQGALAPPASTRAQGDAQPLMAGTMGPVGPGMTPDPKGHYVDPRTPEPGA